MKKNAGEMMEQLVRSKFYRRKEQEKAYLKAVKSTLQKRLMDREDKRFMYKKYDMVAKFVNKNIYEVDHQSLNEYLLDLGLLPCLKMDYQKLKALDKLEGFEPYIMQQDYKFHIAFNKAGKQMNAFPKDYDLKDTFAALGNEYHKTAPIVKSYNEQYEMQKRRMSECKVLKKEKKISHEFGSVSLVKKEPIYDLALIYKELSPEYIIEFGKSDGTMIQKYIASGHIHPKDLDPFRKIVDIRMDFVVMSLEAEEKMMKMLSKKRLTAEKNRRSIGQ